MTNAVAVGATGVTGRALVERLLENNAITIIYTISRKLVSIENPKIKHAFVNLRSSPEDMVPDLSGITAEYVYFCACTALSDPKEMFSVNNGLLERFLKALELTGAVSNIKRFILTCGLKHYGCHLGESKQPMFSQKHGFEYVATLRKDGFGLRFPGNRDNFFSFNTWTSAGLHAQFCTWASTAPGVGNPIFNVVNGDSESWQGLWPKLAAHFGCTILEDPFTSRFKDSLNSSYSLSTRQPIAAHAQAIGITSDPKVENAATIHVPIDLAKWEKLPEVVEAWEQLHDKHGLDLEDWDGATWGFMNMAFGRQFSTVASTTKASKLGWTGYEDTRDEFEATFKVLEAEKILSPPTRA